MDGVALDDIDFALLESLHRDPQIGVLETSRRIRVARATVQSRLAKLEGAGIIAGYHPHLDVAAAGFDVQCFVQLETVQGELSTVTAALSAIPGVLEAFATTGASDVLCRVAAASHKDLQATLLEIGRSPSVARSISIVVLSEIVPYRALPLLRTARSDRTPRAPGYR
ncbi:Lrp/AsnC family transcriptional regulator [Gordonia sp. L191]|uniref:Lrp/AsnC family transcriptional regulator n=1 Tax=Gordonia TaxID=2053 RepID=UPI0024BF29D9|nr:Lrp/AsnC family transcriptional regulator [Gordonia sp. L191]WHU48549.1 Lrp/AsnC family transcriptional regulator [Gordonia sp. L191]